MHASSHDQADQHLMIITKECSAQGLAPFGHLADGRLHLVLVKACSRLQFLRFLASIPSRGGPSQSALAVTGGNDQME